MIKNNNEYATIQKCTLFECQCILHEGGNWAKQQWKGEKPKEM